MASRPNVIVEYTWPEALARELFSGSTFFLCLLLAYSFFRYCWIHRNDLDRAPLLTALGLAVFSAGSAVRTGATWIQFLYENNGWAISLLGTLWPWLAIALVLNSVGATMSLLVLWPRHTARTVLTVAAAVVVPLAVYWAI